MQHSWVRSTLGHGTQMCSRCCTTDAEAAALGILDKCDVPETPATSEPRHLDLVDRLRGQYHLPVNDGAGPLNGSMTFSREFPTPPIQKEAAAEIERLRGVVERLGSSESMTVAFAIDQGSPTGREFQARLQYARDNLNSQPKDGDDKHG